MTTCLKCTNTVITISSKTHYIVPVRIHTRLYTQPFLTSAVYFLIQCQGMQRQSGACWHKARVSFEHSICNPALNLTQNVSANSGVINTWTLTGFNQQTAGTWVSLSLPNTHNFKHSGWANVHKRVAWCHIGCNKTLSLFEPVKRSLWAPKAGLG